jgi:hypothetical protein
MEKFSSFTFLIGRGVAVLTFSRNRTTVADFQRNPFISATHFPLKL